MDDWAPAFTLADAALDGEGIRMAVRLGVVPSLDVTLEAGSAMLVRLSAILIRVGDAQLSAGPLPELVSVQGPGDLLLGPSAPGGLALLSIQPGCAVDVAPDCLLVVTSDALLTRLVGGDGVTLLRLTAPADRPARAALSARGAFQYHALAHGEALDIAPGSLLIKDAGVDLAGLEYLWEPGLSPAGAGSFVQCLGAGAVGLQARL